MPAKTRAACRQEESDGRARKVTSFFSQRTSSAKQRQWGEPIELWEEIYKIEALSMSNTSNSL